MYIIVKAQHSILYNIIRAKGMGLFTAKSICDMKDIPA